MTKFVNTIVYIVKVNPLPSSNLLYKVPTIPMYNNSKRESYTQTQHEAPAWSHMCVASIISQNNRYIPSAHDRARILGPCWPN